MLTKDDIDTTSVDFTQNKWGKFSITFNTKQWTNPDEAEYISEIVLGTTDLGNMLNNEFDLWELILKNAVKQ